MTPRVGSLLIATRNALAAAALVAVLLAAARSSEAAAPPKEGARTAGWTRWIDADQSARELGLRAGTPPLRLARAALGRNAERLGLARGISGLRLARRVETPAGDGARALSQLRFQQYAGSLRIVWGQIDVTVAGGKVRSIAASVVPARRGGATGDRRVARGRALAIARRAVAGPDEARRPLAVAYAGAPTANRRTRLRTARRAWLVEVEPASPGTDETPPGVCVVIDAETGKVIGRWVGMADRADRVPKARRTTPAGAGASASLRTWLSIWDASDGAEPVGGVTPYARSRVTGDPRIARWPEWSETIFIHDRQRTTLMDALTANAQNVVRTVCVVRGFCGTARLPYHPQAFGNDPQAAANEESRADRLENYMSIAPDHIMTGGGDPNQPSNDWIAHEHGHIMDWDYAGDRALSGLNLQSDSVQEALADMFAFDYDWGDATLGEESPAGIARDWATPRSRTYRDSGRRHPEHMKDYDPTPPPAVDGTPSEHFNSTILSHAYYRFVAGVGRTKAGRVLHTVPQRLSPRPTFDEVRRSFAQSAYALYGPPVALQAIGAFTAVGLAPPPHDEPDCGPLAC